MVDLTVINEPINNHSRIFSLSYDSESAVFCRLLFEINKQENLLSLKLNKRQRKQPYIFTHNERNDFFISFCDLSIDYKPLTKKYYVLREHDTAYFWEKIFTTYDDALEYILSLLIKENKLCLIMKIKGRYKRKELL